MIHHPIGLQLQIIGLECSDLGCSCEVHDVCGSVVQLDTVLHLQNEQVMNGMYVILMQTCFNCYNSCFTLSILCAIAPDVKSTALPKIPFDAYSAFIPTSILLARE